MNRLIITLFTTFIALFNAFCASPLSAYAAPSLMGRAGGEASLPVFYASIEQSDAWMNTRASGYYSFATDGRGFTPVGAISTKDITVTDGAVYHDGKIYYLRKTVESLFRYSLDWTVMDATTFEVESRTAKNGLTLAFDMTYDTTTQTCFAASPRSYGEQKADLRRVDLATGDFTTIAPLDVCIRAITADSKGQLWGLGNELIDGRQVTSLYNINKESGALTRIGDVGYQMQETDAALVCDLRDDRIYWAAHTFTDDANWQRTYRRGLAEIDTATGRANFLWDFPANEKLAGLVLNTDRPTGLADPTPLPVTDVVLTPRDNASTAVLTWTAPTECVDRITPLDPATLTYTVTRRNDGRIIASGLTTCRCEDTPDFPMQRVGYTVTTVYTHEGSDFQSAPTQSPLFAIGQPHGVPYLETFDSYNAFFTYTLVDANADMRGDLGNGWFYDQPSQTALYYTTLSRQADDWLVSPTLDLSPDRVYRLRFGTYGYMGNGAVNTLAVALAQDLGDVVQPEGVVSGCADEVIAPRVILDDEYPTEPTSPAFNTTAQPRWLTVLFNPAEGEDRLAFHCMSGPADHMFIDNIYVEDLGPASDFDLDHLGDGDYNDPDADLDRFDDDVLRYVTDLRLADAPPATPCPASAPAATPCPADGPSATPCTAVNGGVSVASAPTAATPTLQWSPATTLPRLRPSVEDADALPAFTLDGGNGWTTYDADGARTIGIGTNQGALEWPHTTEAQAFIVFNPHQLGVESIIQPHSGEQCFISFAAAGRSSDDWLISPLLSGQKARFKFWAKCLYPECLNEQFEVWASYDSPDVSAVKAPLSASAAPSLSERAGGEAIFRLAGPVTVSSATEWHEYAFTLPEGIRYVMIRCTSDSQFGLMIDDVTFPAAPAPTEFWGYNVYCDGKIVARELPDCCFSLAAPMPSASADGATAWPPCGSYTVTAQYAEGESRPSNAVEYIIEGIDNVLAPGAAGSASSAANPVYDLQGRPAPKHSTNPRITIQGPRKQLR